MNIDALRDYMDAGVLALMFIAALALALRALGPWGDD